MRYTAQIRLFQDGKVVYTESETFGKKALAKAWVDKREQELCCKCHGDADCSYLTDSREGHSQQFLLLVIATHLQLFVEDCVVASGVAQFLLLELAGNAAALLEAGEDELHRRAMAIAEHWDYGTIKVVPVEQ